MPKSKENSKTPVYDSLKDQYKLFVDCYIDLERANFNKTEAAIQAGYSKKTAHVQGHRLLRNVKIQEAIKERLNELCMGPEEALRRLSVMASGSLRPFTRANEYGDVYINLGTEEAQDNLHLLKKIKQTKVRYGKDEHEREEVRTEIDIHDPKDALIQILKIHGKFVDRHEHSGPGGGPIPFTSVNTDPFDGK